MSRNKRGKHIQKGQRNNPPPGTLVASINSNSGLSERGNPEGFAGRQRDGAPGDSDLYGRYRNSRSYMTPNTIADVDVDANWFCYDDQTEVLTSHRGWVKFANLNNEDMVATMDPRTRRFEWQKPTHRPSYDYVGTLYHFQSRSVDLMVTPEHRMLSTWLTRKAADALKVPRGQGEGVYFIPAKVMAETLNHHVTIPLAADGWLAHDMPALTIRHPTNPDCDITIPGDAYCALLGLYLSEGSLRRLKGKETTVYIWQKASSSHFEKIEAICRAAVGNRFGYSQRHGTRHDPGKFNIYSEALAHHFAQFGKDCYSKFIPLAVRNTSRKQLQLFWDAYMMGDGSSEACVSTTRQYRRTVKERIHTSSRLMADQLQEIAAKLGYSASIKVRDLHTSLGHAVNGGRPIQSVAPSYRVGMRMARNSSTLRVTQHRYAGRVYCVSVPHATVYVRRNGLPCWSGNSPFQPVDPFGPPFWVQPREFDYEVGYNLQFIQQRQQFYDALQAMATWGIVAVLIQRRIDQFLRQPYEFRLIGKEGVTNPRIEELKAFFRKPDGKERFSIWARKLLEDMFTIDAATVYLPFNRGGKPMRAQVITGTSIFPLIDDEGRRPDYPSPAFQQRVKGLPMLNFNERELLYRPMRPRPRMPIYGYSPVEQIQNEILLGLRRITYQNDFYTEGSMPETILSVPETWSSTQIASFQGFFDTLLGGNISEKSRVRFVPGGMTPYSVKNANGEALKCDIDEWVTRIACFAFATPPEPFVKAVNRAQAEQSQDAAEEASLHPLNQWFSESIMNDIIQDGFGYDDIEFAITIPREVDQLKQAQANNLKVNNGSKTRNEARKDENLPPLEGGDELTVTTKNGVVRLADSISVGEGAANQALNPPEPQPAAHPKQPKGQPA